MLLLNNNRGMDVLVSVNFAKLDMSAGRQLVMINLSCQENVSLRGMLELGCKNFICTD